MKRGPEVRAILLLLVLVPAFGGFAANGPEREYQKSVALRSGGTVEIRNISGSVTVSGWDREEVEIFAVASLNTGMTDDEAEAAKLLDAVEIRVEHGWNKVEIKTVYPAGEWDVEPSDDNELSLDFDFDGFDFEDGPVGFLNKIMGMVGKLVDRVSSWATSMVRGKMPVSVSYHVKVPENCDLDVKSVTGAILITGVEGEIEAKLVTGNISLVEAGGELDCSVVAGQVEIEGAGGFIETSVITGAVTISVARGREFNGIDCTVVNGDVLVRVPEGTAMDLDLKTVNGKITRDKDWLGGGIGRGARYQGSVAGGGPKLEIKAINGSISLERAVR